MPFIDKKILPDTETVGDQLKAKREQLGLSIDEISQKININKNHLIALESGSFEKLPEGSYGQIFLTKYAAFLKLSVNKIKKEFLKEKTSGKKDIKGYAFSPKEQVKKLDLLLLPKILKNFFIALFIIIFFIYIGVYLTLSLSPPAIEILAPEDNFITSENSVEIIGKTDNKVIISINDKLVLSDEDGSFKQIIDLKRGINVITIVAKKKYGQSKTIKKQILVE